MIIKVPIVKVLTDVVRRELFVQKSITFSADTNRIVSTVKEEKTT